MEQTPVTANVLKWARETAGLSVEDVVKKLRRKRITKEVIEGWERGEGAPSYPQLEALAYAIYKRPIALFFFPEPPYEETPEQSFRTLPEYEIKRMPSRLHFLIRQARVMQINLSELNENLNPANRHIVRDMTFDPDTTVSDMAGAVRDYLNVDLATQFQWENTGEALKAWRDILEEHGIFIFKNAFRDDAFSGFCLYDEQFPIIYINNSKSDTRQIFTLFHELAHLLFKTGGVDTRFEDYMNYLHGNARKIEMLSNRFAGAFLVPDIDFDHRTINITVDDSSLRELANRYCVSREVILRKFLERRLVSNSYYEEKVAQWAREARGKVGQGGDYYRTKGVYLGLRYIELAFGRYYKKKISVEQLANYLGVKVKNVHGIEAALYAKGVGG